MKTPSRCAWFGMLILAASLWGGSPLWSQSAPTPPPTEQDPQTDPVVAPKKPVAVVAPPKIDPKVRAMSEAATSVDLTKRRIVGREKLELAPSLTVHADQRNEANGRITLTGRIYVDGVEFKGSSPIDGYRMYGNKLVWDPVKKLAVLTEAVFMETSTAQLDLRYYGTTPDSSITIDLGDGGKVRVVNCSTSANIHSQ